VPQGTRSTTRSILVQRRDLGEALAEAPFETTSSFCPAHRRRDRHLHGRRARARDEQRLVGGRRARRRAQLGLQPLDDV